MQQKEEITHGMDVRISDRAEITRPHLVKMGSHIAIDTGVYISTAMDIGDYVHIAPYVCIIGGANAKLIMHDFTNISAGCKIICAGESFKAGLFSPIVPIEYREVINKMVIFNRFSAVGVNTVVMPGVILAEGSVVGAGSVLTKDTEPWTIYVGSPARPIGERDSWLILKGAKELGYDV